MIKIAVCDDNLDYLNTVENYLENMGNKLVSHDIYMSGEELIAAYENNNASYDAIFLDMEMGGLDGIETANCIRKIDGKVIIVFVTNYEQYMKRSFECEPFRFLLKPVNFDDIQMVLEAIFTKLSNSRSTFVFSVNREKIRLYAENIIYFEKQSHWVYIHTIDDIYRIKKSMKELYEAVDTDIFTPTHKSYIINLRYVKTIKDKLVTLYNSTDTIPISRSYRKNLCSRFTEFKERKYVL